MAQTVPGSDDAAIAATGVDGEVAVAATVAEERVSVASQWQLMWWRFRKHKLAMVGAAVVILFYVAVLFADRDIEAGVIRRYRP